MILAELILFRLVVVAGGFEALDEFGGIEIMSAAKILKGIAVIAEGGIDETDKQMGIHRVVVAEVHFQILGSGYICAKWIFKAYGVEGALKIAEAV